MDVFNKLKSTVTSTVNQISSVLPGNPVTREYDITGANSTIGSKEPPPKNTVEELDLVMNNKAVCGLHVGLLCENAPQRLNDIMEDLFKMCRDKEIEPIIHDVYSFDEIHTAQKELLERRNVGKVLVKPYLEIRILNKKESSTHCF
ncbi:uncharacterized protein LOC103507234, partial [Diaphorina citri]|uniref:Uncharacterized protein LOC103507234 n=1 Tax=Diaphorina citri TaxID=121845 RepID=A0A3Q0IT69_DIACI